MIKVVALLSLIACLIPIQTFGKVNPSFRTEPEKMLIGSGFQEFKNLETEDRLATIIVCPSEEDAFSVYWSITEDGFEAAQIYFIANEVRLNPCYEILVYVPIRIYNVCVDTVDARCASLPVSIGDLKLYGVFVPN